MAPFCADKLSALAQRADRPPLVWAQLLYSACNHQWTEAATQLQLLGGAALDDGEEAGLCDVEEVHEIPRNPDLLYIFGFFIEKSRTCDLSTI